MKIKVLAWNIIELRGRRVTCIATHLSLREKYRTKETERLLRLVNRVGGTLLLAGDLNSGPETTGIRALSSILTDVFADDPRPTFSTVNLRKRVDYLFMSSDCNSIDKKVPLVEGSDHLPLIRSN